MTNPEERQDEELRVVVSPEVQVVLADGTEHALTFADLIEGDMTDDPATVADDRLIELVARHLDTEVASLGTLQVTRPDTGNVLISPKAQFGNG